MKLVHPCPSIDWAAFDSHILVLQGDSVAEHHPAEISGLPGSRQSLVTKK